MLRFYGYDFEVSVNAYYKVAMSKRRNKDDIEEEAFNATCRMYEHESFVKVFDNVVTEINQDDEYFTVADVKIDLRVHVVAHDYEEAFEKAEAEATLLDLPAGVAFVEAEPYDYEWSGEECVGE